MKRPVIQVNFVMKNVDFYFEYFLGKVAPKQTDNLSESLQSSNLSAAMELQLREDLATIAIRNLEEDKKNDQFKMFGEDIIKKNKFLDVGDPILPRRRKLQKKFGEPETIVFL